MRFKVIVLARLSNRIPSSWENHIRFRHFEQYETRLKLFYVFAVKTQLTLLQNSFPLMSLKSRRRPMRNIMCSAIPSIEVPDFAKITPGVVDDEFSPEDNFFLARWVPPLGGSSTATG
jgi:hypothetical protein